MAETSRPNKRAKLPPASVKWITDDPKIKFTVVVSNFNKLYCLCHETKTITWSGQADSLQPYRSFRRVNDRDYLFAKIDENGAIVIVYQDGKGNEKSFPWKDFFSGVKKDGNMEEGYHTTEGSIEFASKLGGPLGKIKRTTHFINTSSWEFSCPIFEVDDETIQVRSTLSHSSFLSLCQEFAAYKTPEGASLLDLNMHLFRDQIELTPDGLLSDGLFKGSHFENFAHIHIHRGNVNVFQKTKHLRTLSGVSNENIQGYYGMKKDGENYLYAFEPLRTTLADHVEFVIVKNFTPQFLDMLRGIIKGLKCIHALNLSHGNIQPWNTYVEDGVFKYGAYDEWSPLTEESRVRDYKLVARLIAYIFSWKNLEVKVGKDEYLTYLMRRLIGKMPCIAREAHAVVEMLMRDTDKDLLDRVLLEPWLWKADRSLVYYKEIKDILYDDYKTYTLEESDFEKNLSRCWGSSEGWGGCFDDKLMQQFNSNNQYKTKRADELIRFLRNLYGHHLQFEGEMLDVQKCSGLGKSLEELEYIIRRAVPHLLQELFKEVRRQKLHTSPMLKYFYKKY